MISSRKLTSCWKNKNVIKNHTSAKIRLLRVWREASVAEIRIFVASKSNVIFYETLYPFLPPADHPRLQQHLRSAVFRGPADIRAKNVGRDGL